MGIWGVDIIRQVIEEIVEPVKPEPPPPQTQARVDNQTPDSRVGEMRLNSNIRRFQLQSAPTVQTYAQSPQQRQSVDMEKVETIFNSTLDGSYLAARTSNEFTQLNEAEKLELVAMAVRSDRADQLLTSFWPAQPPNVTYDEQKQVATMVGQAYTQGRITDADLRSLADRLQNASYGPESAAFVEILSQAPENVKVGGVVEAYGKQAQSLGQTQAAALAFSSSEALIRTNLPNYDDKQAAYEQVKSYLTSEPLNRVPDARYGASPILQSSYVEALGNFARLHSWGMGSDAEFDEVLEQAGPRFVQEAIARSSKIEGDDGYYCALQMFGDASERMAAKTDGDDKRDWFVNAAMSYTQSPELIRNKLSTPQQRIAAFDLLNHTLADSRDPARDAATAFEPYTLLRAPAQAEGIANLLAEYPEEIINAKLGTNGDNAQGQADLVNLLETTVFSPYTSAETRTKIQNSIESYIAREAGKADNDSQHIGNRLGGLLGVLQVASQKAVDDAKKPEEKTFIQEVSTDLAKTVIKAGADALLAETGPVGKLAGGFVLDQVLKQVFDGKPPTAGELGDAYIKKLEAAHVNISLGEELGKQYVALLSDIATALNEQRDHTTGQANRNVVDASIQNGQLLDGIDYTPPKVVQSYQLDVGQLHQALGNWSDGYKYSGF